MMKTLEIVIIDHRARCKYCGDLPSYYTNTIGIGYHTFDSIKGTNKPQQRLTFLSEKEEGQNLNYKTILRNNSIQGTCSTSSFFFKKHKEGLGTYRILITCKCGESVWMFPGPCDDPLPKNRTLRGDFYKYPQRYWMKDFNVKW